MVCSNCGSELPMNAVACPSCGALTGGGYQNYSNAPALKFKANYSLVKYIFLGLITFGIYPIVVMSSISERINIIASRYDNRRTMHFCLLAFLVTGITLGIGALVWYNNISDRIGAELRRRNIPIEFGASTYWLWNVLGSLIIVGPFIYLAKLFGAMNALCEDYNVKG
ncbi:MAG: DUF4234 domain-containing protein [Oscillospiraceae bacterium]|nr:DUF4234 domain-containing protein [Oscillospiraceae bacterium]